MNLRSALLGTTAMLGAAALVVPSDAAAFDVNINGFFNFNAVMGDLEDALGGNRGDFDFVTDSEIHIQGVNVDDETGIRYGFMVEFETDPQTSNNNNIDESYIFVQGAFGDIRLGNEDGVLDNSKLGAYVIASGTGGIDGQDAVVARVPFAPTDSNDSTKIRYSSPSFAGFTAHASYTPNVNVQGNQIANRADDAAFPVDYKDFVEGGLVYDGAFGGVDLRLSGVFGFADGHDDNDDITVFNVGAVVGFAGISVAGSYWEEDDGPNGDTKAYTLGAAAGLGPATVSVNWADVFDSDGPEGQNLVLSAAMGLLPGMALQGDVSFFDNDIDDDGIAGVVRLRVAF